MSNRLRYSALLVLLFWAVWAVCPSSAAVHYNRYPISIGAGLSQTSVTDIVKDGSGAIWFGTYRGLNSLRNDRMVNFYHDPADDGSIQSNFINSLCCDTKGRLWVLTDRGLCRYRGGGKFVRYSDNVTFIYAVDERMFVVGDNGLSEYDSATDSFVQFCDLEGRLIIVERFDTDHLIAVTREGVLLMIDLYSATITNLNLQRLPFWGYNSIKVDADSNVWLSTSCHGVIECRVGSDGLYEVLRLFNVASNNLRNDMVTDLLIADNTVWAATDGGGIEILDSAADRFENIDYVKGNEPIPVNSVICLALIDQHVWAGTVKAGAIEIRTTEIRYIGTSGTMSVESFGSPVIAVIEDSKGRVWFGTDGDGIKLFDRKHGVVESFASTRGKKVVSLAELPSDELLVAVFDEGFCRFNIAADRLTPLSFMDNDFRGGCVPLFFDCGDTVVVGGQMKLIYDKRSHHFTKAGPNCGSSVVPVFANQNEWIGYDDYAVLKIDRADMSKMESVFHRSSKIDAAAYEIASDKMWLCVEHELLRLNLDDGTTERFSFPLSDNVYTMAFDHHGRLWIGMTRNILCFIPDENRFVIYDNTDGVIANEYFRRSSMVARNGDIYMCGVNGVAVIPASMSLNKLDNIVSVVLDRFAVDGEPAVCRSNGVFRIPSRFNSIEVRLIVDKRDSFKKDRFRFQVAGSNNIVVESDDEQLTLPQMVSGRYSLSVSSLTSYGTWTSAEHIADFRVLPPLWLRWYAIVIYCVLAVAAAVCTYLYIVRLDRKRIAEMRDRDARKLADRKIEFMINISHELRTPLTLIYTPLKAMLDSDSYTDSQKGELKQIFRQAANMNRLVDMTLEMRNMESDGGSIDKSVTNFNDWLVATVEQFDSQYRLKQIFLSVEVCPQVEPFCFDSDKCSIVLSNLLNNALKYSSEGTGVKVAASIVERDRGTMVRVEVIDRGMGIEGVEVSKLFERYYQRNSRSEGYGIGLSYAKMIVDKHGGNIGAVPNRQGGSTFFFELPYTLESVDRSDRAALFDTVTDRRDDDSRPSAGVDARKLSVLFIDDNADIRSMLASNYEGRFSSIRFAADGVDGLESARTFQPDVVVCDVMMPAMDGITFCRELKTDIAISHIPVVLLTALSDPVTTVAGYKVGADAYISKPFDPELLFNVIRNLANMCLKARNRFLSPDLLVRPEENLISSADEEFIKRLNKYIVEHLSDSLLDAPAIVSYMAMGRATFYNKIKQLTGQGIMSYVARIRMQRAAQLLAGSDYQIGEIAFMVGYNDQKYFSKQFRALYGTTPSSYRKSKSVDQ